MTKPYSYGDDDDEDRPPGGSGDDAPPTPTDEPPPLPIQDPPSDDTPGPPLTVPAPDCRRIGPVRRRGRRPPSSAPEQAAALRTQAADKAALPYFDRVLSQGQ